MVVLESTKNNNSNSQAGVMPEKVNGPFCTLFWCVHLYHEEKAVMVLVCARFFGVVAVHKYSRMLPRKRRGEKKSIAEAFFIWQF